MSKYEPPILVPLGEMAKASGDCSTGYDNDVAACSGGNGQAGPYGSETCSEGASPVDYCDAGTCATRLGASYCTAGFTAASYCEAGSDPETGSLE